MYSNLQVTPTWGASDFIEGGDAIQRDPDRLEKWAYMNLTKFSKT